MADKPTEIEWSTNATNPAKNGPPTKIPNNIASADVLFV
jgi:hypothetical protein